MNENNYTRREFVKNIAAAGISISALQTPLQSFAKEKNH